MNTEPFLPSTFVPWTVNGPTALPQAEALAAVDPPPSPSGSSSATTTSGASTSATPRTKLIHRDPGHRNAGQPDSRANRPPNRLPFRSGPSGVMDPFHVATGKLPPDLHGRRGESS